MLSPDQFRDFYPADADYHGSAADYGAGDTRLSSFGMQKKASADAVRGSLGTTDKSRTYSGPIEASVALKHRFVSHMKPGNN